MLIRNKRTGQVMNVVDGDLNKYGLGQPSLQTTQPQTKAGLLGMQTRDNGNTGVGGFVSNAISDIGQNVGGLLSIPGMAVNLIKNPSQAPEVGKNLVKNIATDYASLANDPLGEAYNRPLSTILNLLPFLKAGKTLAGLGKAGKAADVVSDVSKVGKVSETGNVLQESGKYIKGSVGKIYTKASAYGAAEENLIRKTLDELNITGPAAQQYSKLGPTIKNLSTQIDEVIKTTPVINTSGLVKKNFIESFKDNLFGEGMSQKQALGELQKVVKRETGKSLDDLTDIDINNLRLRTNKAYSPITNRIKNGTATNEQLVIAASRDALTQTLIDLHPEAQKLISQQSALFRAVPALNTARKTNPTTRVLGITAPKPIIEGAATTAGNILEGTGNKVSQFQNSLLGKTLSTTGKIITTPFKPSNLPITSLVGRGLQGQQPQQDSGQPPEQTDSNVSNYDVGNNSEQQQSISQFGGLSADKISKAKVLDLLYNKGRNFATLDKLSKELSPSQGKQPSAAAQKEIIKGQAAVRALDRVQNELIGSNGDLSKVWKSKLPFAPGSQTYRADWGSIIDAIGSFRTGAAYTPEQRKDYAYMLPSIGDSKEVIKSKINNLRQELQGYADMMKNTSGESDVLQSLLGVQ